MNGSGIRHVLFDADGVIQRIPGGWYAAMEPYLGDRAREFLHATWKDEVPTLSGAGEYLPLLTARLAEYGVSVPVAEIVADVWHRIEVDEGSVGVVREVRALGYGVHLGTNQERLRAAHMQTALGYADLFDTCTYSFELGAAKPDPAFFRGAARTIGAATDQILFIDDTASNVEAARSVGMTAERWDIDEGVDALRRILLRHGIRLS